MRVNLQGLESRLNPFCTRSLEVGSGLSVTRSHYEVAEQLAARCTGIESCMRNIDHIVSKALLPLISSEILNRIGEEIEYLTLILRINENGEFDIELS